MRQNSTVDIPKKIDMDDGYFPLAQSALLTLAKTKLSGAQRAIVDVIFTQTYGYYNEASQHQERIKKRYTRARISYEYFMQVTWMGKQEVSRAVNALVNWNILGRDKNTSPYTYWFNVHPESWAPGCWRVSRIANNKQDSEQEKLNSESQESRDSQQSINNFANSSQDSEQLAGQLTKSSQDSEQGVSRIANSSQVSARESQDLARPLKKDLKKDQINSSSLTTTTGQSPEVEVINGSLKQTENNNPTSKDLIAELTSTYRELEGIKPYKGDFAFIGSLYNKYGYDQVLDAINKLQMAAAVQELTSPLLYLKGILENQQNGKQKSQRDPPDNAASNKKKEFIRSLYMS